VALPAAPGPGAVVQGTLGNEPLHFEADSGGVLRAVAGVPLGDADSLPLDVVARDATGAIAWSSTWVRLAPRSVRTERITTGPAFRRAPDSALAARIARERERVRAVFAQSHDTPRLWDDTFVRPRPGRIRSGFGTRRVVNGKAGGRHWGVDLAGATGTPVRATNRGVVVLTADTFYGGCAVYLDHGAGLVTGYLHLNAIVVAPGDTLARGQLLGRVGASGRVTGPHLHWLAHYGAIAIDPAALMELDPWPAAPLTGGTRAQGRPLSGSAVPRTCRR
jgi:murein DD-endopeptidase MepM/ murein hydrolase activator NlpD